MGVAVMITNMTKVEAKVVWFERRGEADYLSSGIVICNREMRDERRETRDASASIN